MRLFLLIAATIACCLHASNVAAEPARARVSLQLPGPCGSVAFTPDGKRLLTTTEQAAGSGKYQLWVWDAVSGKRLHGQLAGSGVSPGTEMGISLAVSHDGRRAIMGRHDGIANLWDLTTGKQLGELPCYTPKDPYTQGGTRVEQVAFAPDDKTAVTLEWTRDLGAVVRTWDASTGKPIGNPQPRASRFAPLQFTAQGKLESSENGFDTPLKLAAPKPSLNDQFLCAAYCPNGKTALTGTYDGRVFIWDMRSRKTDGDALLLKPADKKSVAEALFHEVEGKMSREQFGSLIGDHQFMAIVAASSQDSKIAAVGMTLVGGQHAHVWVWDLEKRNILAGPYRLTTPESRRGLKGVAEWAALTRLTFSPDGSTLAILTQPNADAKRITGEVQLWDVPSRKK